MNEEMWEFGSKIFEDGLLSFTIRSVIILLAANLVYRGIRSIASRIWKKSGHENEIAYRYFNMTVRAVIYAVAVLSVLSLIKPLQAFGTALLGASSVIAVIVGLAAQETFGNYISGFFLAIYQPFQVGDIVTLTEKGIFGTVTEITFRHTVLITFENTKLIIPNSVMNNAVIEDKILEDKEYTKFLEVTVGYDTDIEEAKKIIWDIASHTENIVDNRTEQEKKDGVEMFPILLNEFMDSGVQLRFPITTNTLPNNRFACSDMRINMLKEFRKAGIEIPYQKIDIVHSENVSE